MVEDIYQKTGYSINANTLRRFFGLVKTAYSASPSTLTILCKYCGFNSIDEIENIAAPIHSDETINKEEVLHYLINLFQHLPVHNLDPDILAPAIQQTVYFLERTPALIDRFQREVAKFPAGQYYYYELAVNMDRLNGFYGDGLRYYLRAKKSDEGQAFGNAIMVLKHWLSDEPELVEKSMAAIPSGTLQGYPTHIVGRVSAARLFLADVRHEPIDKIVLDAVKYQVASMSKKDFHGSSSPQFDLPVCEALVLTGHFHEAYDFLRRGKGQPSKNLSENPYALWEEIVHSRRNTHLKKLEDLKKKSLSVPDNAPINKKYNNLLFSIYNTRRQEQLLRNMIEETGYHRFKKING